MTLRVVVPPHPLISHWLTMLRNRSTPAPLYAKGLEEVGKWLTYEALREWLPYRKEKIQTPHLITEGTVIESRVTLLAIPNLPGGIELWHGGREVMPNAQLCLSGIPSDISEKSGILIYMDQIKNDDDLLQKLNALKELNVAPKRVRIITAIASSKGLKKIGEKFEDLTIFSCCIDEKESEDGEIIPGIGNPSMRLNSRNQTSN